MVNQNLTNLLALNPKLKKRFSFRGKFLKQRIRHSPNIHWRWIFHVHVFKLQWLIPHQEMFDESNSHCFINKPLKALGPGPDLTLHAEFDRWYCSPNLSTEVKETTAQGFYAKSPSAEKKAVIQKVAVSDPEATSLPLKIDSPQIPFQIGRKDCCLCKTKLPIQLLPRPVFVITLGGITLIQFTFSPFTLFSTSPNEGGVFGPLKVLDIFWIVLMTYFSE